jgi:hypothetical protein
MLKLLDPDIIKTGGIRIWLAQCKVLCKHGKLNGHDSRKDFYFRLQESLAGLGTKDVDLKQEVSREYRTTVLANWIEVMNRIENPDRDIICAYLLSEVIEEPKFTLT